MIEIDEALLEGELSGTLFVVTKDHLNGYEESTYDLAGITDGNIVEFYTTVAGESRKMIGQFYGGAKRFHVTFWLTDDKVVFEAMTKEHFEQVTKMVKQ